MEISQDRAKARKALKDCYDIEEEPDRRSGRLVTKGLRANHSNAFSYERLGLTKWLMRFRSRTSDYVLTTALQPKLKTVKLTTRFKLEVDFTSSFKRLVRIIPIDNFPLGTINPEGERKLEIEFEGGSSRPDKKLSPSSTDCLLLNLQQSRPDSAAQLVNGSQTAKACDDVLKKSLGLNSNRGT